MKDFYPEDKLHTRHELQDELTKKEKALGKYVKWEGKTSEPAEKKKKKKQGEDLQRRTMQQNKFWRCGLL